MEGHMRRYITLSALIYCAMYIFPANAQQDLSEKTISRILQTQNSKLLFHTDAPIVVPPPAAMATSAGLGDGYATITYEIGSTSCNVKIWKNGFYGLPTHYRPASAIRAALIPLPSRYTMAWAKHCWQRNRFYPFNGRQHVDSFSSTRPVSDLRSTSWQGTLISDMPVTQVNRAVRIGIEVYQTKGPIS